MNGAIQSENEVLKKENDVHKNTIQDLEIEVAVLNAELKFKFRKRKLDMV